MTFVLLTKVRSGLPGKSFRLSEYRYPSRCTMDLIAFSAPVFRVCTDAIILLLVVLSTRSILHFLLNDGLGEGRGHISGLFPSCVRILARQRPGAWAKQHSQMRITVQPLCRRMWVARWSLARFRSIFSRHACAFVLAVRFLPQSCPCQKQPSTNTASLGCAHMKSGRPRRSWCRRHPAIPAARSRDARRFSVVWFPVLGTRDMSSPRCSPPNVVHSF
jgi:hypothetical protein